MVSDTLFDALNDIECYERDFPSTYFSDAERIRKVKVEMRLLQLYYDPSSGVGEDFTPADYDWIRTESLKRGETTAPHQFSKVLNACIAELNAKKSDGWQAAPKSSDGGGINISVNQDTIDIVIRKNGSAK